MRPLPRTVFDMLVVFSAVAFVLLMSTVAVAADRERGFFDVYGGGLYLFESDIRGSTFADDGGTLGGRIGVWVNDNWGVALRAWYFQTDANVLTRGSPSDLALSDYQQPICIVCLAHRTNDRRAVPAFART